MKSPQVRVPKAWLDVKKQQSKQLGISIPQTIWLTDQVYMEVLKKSKGRKGSVFEIKFPKK